MSSDFDPTLPNPRSSIEPTQAAKYSSYLDIPVHTPIPPPPPKRSRVLLMVSVCLCIASTMFLVISFALMLRAPTQATQPAVKTQQVIQKPSIFLTPTPPPRKQYTALQILSQMTGISGLSPCQINNATGFSSCEAFDINGATGNQDNILLVYPSVHAAQQAYVWHTTNAQSDSKAVFQHNLCLLVILPVAGVQYPPMQVLSVVQQLDHLCV